MGIDTLTIAQDSSSGGGGGGSGSGIKYEDVAISDKIKNNLGLIKNLLEGIAALAIGLAFGKTAASIALVLFGTLDLIDAFKNFINTGSLTKDMCMEMSTGFLKIGIGLALLTGSWIPLAIGAFLALGSFLSGWWDDITAFFRQDQRHSQWVVRQCAENAFRKGQRPFASIHSALRRRSVFF